MSRWREVHRRHEISWYAALAMHVFMPGLSEVQEHLRELLVAVVKMAVSYYNTIVV